MQQCARGSLAYKPKTGSMILFWSLQPDGEIDMGATHTACPVLKGEKWSAPLWIRQSAFQPSTTSAAPGGSTRTGEACVDLDPSCRVWAAAGECEKNAAFMTGADGSVGQCRNACSACPYPKREAAVAES